MKTIDEDTRLFYVVDAPEVNEELFETYREAEAEYKDMARLNIGARLRICEVNHAYRDGNGWNYEDFSDTFSTIQEIYEQE